MWNLRRTCLACILSVLSVGVVATESAVVNVVEDGGVGLTYEELEYLVRQWTPQMREVAAKDPGDRLELLSLTLANKRIAEEAKEMLEDLQGDDYWAYMTNLQGTKRNFVLKQVGESLEIPDFTELAKERYATEKDKYALIKERRTSSHILFKDAAKNRKERVKSEKKAQAVLDELRAGADFEAMVAEHSADPGSKSKGGKFDRWMTLGDESVTPRYSGALFEIDEIGGYSEIVGTQFGVHIIRLDGIQEKSYKPFEEVKSQIMADLETEYRKLAMKDYLSQFRISDEAYIDGDAMDRLFAPYQTEQAQ